MRRTAVSALVLALAAATCSLTACGGVADGEAGDGGESNDAGRANDAGEANDVGPVEGGSNDATVPILLDSGLAPTDAAGDSNAVGGGPVDAGYYYGDGSYWVDGGAYPVLPDASDQDGTGGESDAASIDASTGCGALSACCVSLSGASQSLCNSVAGAGDATNCLAELTQLESGGDCMGVTILASQIQLAGNLLVSDGTTLFWTTFESSPGLLAVPVGGGAVTTLLSAPTGGGGAFLAVDDVNVYVLEGSSLIRVPKNGDPPTLINEPGANVSAATSLDGTAYWVESLPQSSGMIAQPVAVKSAPLLGDTVTALGTFTLDSPDVESIAVTSSTVFLGSGAGWLFDFPIGAPPSGDVAGDASACNFLSSDTDAVYCAESTGSNERIASDGTMIALGPTIDSELIVYDDTYAYWVDATTVGTIMKAPKAGGGSAIVLAHDTEPTAIAVDANSVYWMDQEGYIKSIPK